MKTKDKIQEEIDFIALLLALREIRSKFPGDDSTHPDSDSNSK